MSEEYGTTKLRFFTDGSKSRLGKLFDADGERVRDPAALLVKDAAIEGIAALHCATKKRGEWSLTFRIVAAQPGDDDDGGESRGDDDEENDEALLAEMDGAKRRRLQ